MSFEHFDSNTIKISYKDVNHDYNIDVGTEYKMSPYKKRVC